MAEEHTGGMIALIPADPRALAITDGEPADELHVTVLYLGGDVGSWLPGQREAVHRVARSRAEVRPPIEARIFGHATFNPDGGADGTREPCLVYLVGDTSELGHLRAELTQSLREEIGEVLLAEQHEPYIPHATVYYGHDSEYGTKARHAGAGTARHGRPGVGEGDKEFEGLPDLGFDPQSAPTGDFDTKRREGARGTGHQGGHGDEAGPPNRTGRGRASRVRDSTLRGSGASHGETGGQALGGSRGRAATNALLGPPHSLQPDQRQGMGGLPYVLSRRDATVSAAQPGSSGNDRRTARQTERAGAPEVKNAGGAGEGSGVPTGSPRPSLGEALARLTFTGPVVFDRIRVALGDEVTDYPLGGGEMQADDVDNWLEEKVMSADPGAVELRRYWVAQFGKRWRKWRELRRLLGRHIKNPERADGATTNIYRLATGHLPPRGGEGKSTEGYLSEVELKAAMALADPDSDLDLWAETDDEDEPEDDDADALYEQALVDGVDWEINAAGELERTDDDEGDGEDEPAGPRTQANAGPSLFDLYG